MGFVSVECLVYLQLFLGWIVLCLTTLALCLVPESAMFFGLSHEWNNVENLVVYGFMVLAEISLFFVLLVVATMVMSFGRRPPSGVGLIHLIVDPALAPVVAVPMLTIRGLSSCQTLFRCHHQQRELAAAVALNQTPSMLPTSDCGDQLVTYLLGLNGSKSMELDLLDNSLHGHVMSSWITCLQCLLLLPVLLRTLRYHWKMAWQPFLQSNLYLTLQALDIALLENFIFQSDLNNVDHHLSVTNVISIITVTFTTTALCLGSTAILTPPIYLGNNITNAYLRILLCSGVVVCDLPFLVLRLVISYYGYAAMVYGEFMLMTVKEIGSVLFLFCFWIKQMQCFGRLHYKSLARQETSDTVHMYFQDGEQHDSEDFV